MVTNYELQELLSNAFDIINQLAIFESPPSDVIRNFFLSLASLIKYVCNVPANYFRRLYNLARDSFLIKCKAQRFAANYRTDVELL
jgi:hypothetical protein